MKGSKKLKVIGFIIAILILVLSIVFISANKLEKMKIQKLSAENKKALTYGQLTEQDAKVDNCDYIEFSAFFLRDLNNDGYAERIKGTCKEIGTTDTLYLDFNVLTKGSLKDGKITVNSGNFVWTTSIVNDGIIVDSNYIGNTSSINLKNEIKSGNQKLFYGTISPNLNNNVSNYSKVNSITLTGTYVDENGNETPITKTSEVIIDWYGTTGTEVNKYYYNTYQYTLYDNQIYDITTALTEDSINLSYKVAITETERDLILQKQEVEVGILELNGYKPSKVNVINKDVKFEYDEENAKLKIIKEARKDAAGNVTTIARSNLYDVEVSYPIEGYTTLDSSSISLNIPIVGYNYGYNNEDENFENPYVSSKEAILTVTYSNPTGEIWNVDAYVGNKVYIDQNYKNVVSKENMMNIYNGNVYEDIVEQYTIEWSVLVKNYELLKGITLEEQKEENKNKGDKFLNSSNEYIDMEEYITTTGIYFSNATTMLGENGWIKLYNAETGALLETFTVDSWGNISKSNPYQLNVKSIKIETSAPITGTEFSVTQIKEVNTELLKQNLTREQFDKLSYIYTYVKGTTEFVDDIEVEEEAKKLEINKACFAYYEMPKSIQKISISPKQATNQETKNINFYIDTTSANITEAQWANGIFLVELPEKIIDIDVKKISSSEESVKIQSYNVYEQNGKKYIKIYTENEEAKVYRITIDADITANPLEATSTETIRLYSYNPKADNYNYSTQDIYDIDNDSNIKDYIGYNTCSISLVAPSGLLTTEYISDYDELGSITVAPKVADIEKNDKTKTANVNIKVVNNYSGTISEVKLLGKTPFEGNTYVINGENLNSSFTATMTGKIIVPEELKEIVKVYYSEKENTNKDLNDDSNAWQTESQVKDWTKIKTYFIDFENYSLKRKEEFVFTYEILIPANTEFNDATFSAHAVYYYLDTENGKLEAKTEPNKVGLQIVSQYNLELTKNKKTFENMLVKGATYKVTTKDADGKDISKVEMTDEKGKLKFKDLYIAREYTLKEVAAPSEFGLSKDEIKFIARLSEDGKLEFEVISGEFLTKPEIITDENGSSLVSVKVEDEAKYKLLVNKKDENGNPLNNVKFLIDGKNQVNKTYKTNENGQITIDGLIVDEEYKIQEIFAEGYYIDSQPRTFKLVRNSTGKIEINTQDELLKNMKITEQDNVAMISTEIEIPNEKIPTYDLQIVKIEKNEDDTENVKLLEGADFLVISNDTDKKNEYVTDKNGNIEIPGLYLYVEGKPVTGEYILQEIKAPLGYSNNAEEIKIKVSKQEVLNVEIENKDSLETLKQVVVEGNKVKLIIEDKPLFRLTKKDSETGEVLANAKFVIYEINEQGGEIDFAKDVNGNYVGTLDDSKQYVVTTDENGLITLPLRDGLYKAIEVGFPEGYQEKDNEEVFRVGEKSEEIVEIKEVQEINYIEDLVDLSITVNEGNTYSGKTVVLNKTLDFKEDASYRDASSKTYGDLNKNGEIETIKEELTNEDGIGFSPIGNRMGSYFGGSFDGKGNEIRNIYINSEDFYVGLFGYISDSKIENVGITGKIEGILKNNSNYIGGIVGYSNYSYVRNCYNIAEITNDFSINNNLYSYTGGIVGSLNYSFIKNCYNIGDINNIYAKGYLGGISGTFSSSVIENCYNIGNLNGGYCSGTIVGTSYVSTNVKNCYYLEIVKLQGTSTYLQGDLLTEIYMKSNEFVHDLKSTVWKNDEKNQNQGYPILQYKQEEIKEISEINCIEDLVDLSISVNEGNKYNSKTVLLQRTLDFCEDLSYKNSLDKSYGDLNGNGKIETIKDELINTTGVGFTPIGSCEVLYFSGIFDGNGKEIRNIYINSKDTYVGLFGEVKNAKIKNLGISGIIKTSGSVGGIAGKSIGSKIDSCYNKVNIISSSNDAGGIVGSLEQSQITRCYNLANISAKYDVGGIVGEAYNSNINNSYNRGSIVSTNTNSSYVGGILGYTYNISIENCYNVGNVKSASYVSGIVSYYPGNTSNISVINSYYLETILLQGSTLVQNGKALTENYMKSENFVNDLNNNIWQYDFNNTNQGYPILLEDNITSISIVNEINYIEDLVNFSLLVNSGYTYSNEIVELKKSLDFNADDSYRNAFDKSYGDLNKDGKIENIKEELINKLGSGFIPIGEEVASPFSGVFEGNGYEIKNIFINSKSSKIGLFGYVVNGTIKDLGITGEISCNNNNMNFDIGGIAGNITNSKIENSYNKVNVISESFNGTFNIGGIIGYIDKSIILNCYNQGAIISYGNSGSFNIGGIVGYANDSKIENCYNEKNIDNNGNHEYNSGGYNAGGIVGYSYNSTIINSYNTSKIFCGGSTGGFYSGGIAGNSSNSNIKNCYNLGYIITADGSQYSGGYDAGGIVGSSTNSNIKNCYNLGDVESINKTSSSAGFYAGGIGGWVSNSNIINCYNIGKVNCSNIVSSTSGLYAGGIGAYINGSSIKNCYNVADITVANNYYETGTYYAGGIVGLVYASGSIISNTYNIGNVISIGSNGDYCTGGILGYSDETMDIENSYYLNTILIEGTNINNSGTAISHENMSSEDFYNILNSDGVWGYRSGKYPILFQIPAEIQEGTELVVENTIKKYKLTTDILEVAGQKGGSITGEDEKAVEIVNISNSNTKVIEIIPETGYGISNITINGERIKFVADDDGNYKIPAGYFENITEDKHIVVSFSVLDQILTIKKVDENDNNIVLKDAKFKIEQIDERQEVTNELGNIVANGQIYVIANKEKEITDVIGTMTNNGTYYFVQNGNSYQSNNKGISLVTANSYMQIDLTGKVGEYKVVVNASVSSENNYDYGYANITQSTSAPAYNNTTGQFIKIAGEQSAKEYTSNITLQGGNIYYVHFGYRKDRYTDGGTDQFIINSVKVYEALEESFCFEQKDGKYISNNQQKDDRVANSYIPIDLRNTTGKYDLRINAEISSQMSNDMGYVTITETTVVPAYNSTAGRLIYISGDSTPKDFTTILEAGKLYYLHLGYYKNASVSHGSDTFTINEIELKLNKDDYFTGEAVTNEKGEIKQALNPGKCVITEIEAPEGYVLNKEPIEVNIEIGKANQITITNKKQKELVVHHYLKDSNGNYTTQKVSEDEIYKGDVGEAYATSPLVNLEKLHLEKDTSGEFVIPTNAAGKFTEEAIEVIYYYEPEEIKLTIHHYLDGSEVELKENKVITTKSNIKFEEDGSYEVKGDSTYILNSNEEYKELLADYELSSITSTVKDNLKIDETLNYETDSELTYYYKLKGQTITTQIQKHTELRTDEITNEKTEIQVAGGSITGNEFDKENDINLVEIVNRNESSKTEIVVDPDPNYKVKQIKLVSTDDNNQKTESIIYGEGAVENPEVTFVESENGNITLATFTKVTENKHIIVEFEAILGKIIVHHYVEGTGPEFGNEPVKVPAKQENKVIEDEVRQDYVGEIYTSKQSENIATIYELVSTSGNVSGKYKETETNIYYYYQLKDYNYTINYFYDGIEDISKIEKKQARYGSTVSEYPDKPEGLVFENVTPQNETDKTKANLVISDNETSNVINVYYKTQFIITTDVIEHTEEHKDGTIAQNVKGGQISGEDEASYENVLKGYKPQKTIKITPNEGYEITKIIIKENKTDESGKIVNLDDITLNEDGSIVLPTKYLANEKNGMLSNKHVEVEFRKETNIIVKHLEEGTGNVLYKNSNGEDFDKLVGYEGKEFTTGRKSIQNYIASDLGITDENNNTLATYSKVSTDNKNFANGTMYADPITIVYWYKKAEPGIVVKHIEINEQDKKDGLTENSGILLEETLGTELTTRNTYENYISVDGPESENENLIIVEKTATEKEVVYEDGTIVEIRYYYQKQHNITTEVKPHTEIVDGIEKSVEGGTISKEYITNNGVKEETVYETVLSRGDNAKTIVITPDKGYKVKSLLKEKKIIQNGQETVVSEELFIEDIQKDDYTIILSESFLKDVQNDYNIAVEFERMETKVIVEHIDIDTKEIIETETIEGIFGDEYKTKEKEYIDYIFVESKYPENSTGNMTEEVIKVVYYYTKQFQITTDVVEHTEVDKKGDVSKVKGGSITGEDITPYEFVKRGAFNTSEIVVEPFDGYRIKEIKINGSVIEYISDENIIKEGKKVKLPKEYFVNMQEDKNITVEFERIPATVKVKYVEIGTGKILYKTSDGLEYVEISGYVNEEYETIAKEIENYELVKEKYPSNSKGKMTENEIIVIYYYKKIEIPVEKPEVKPEEKPEVKPEDKPEIKPETKPEVEKPIPTPEIQKPEVDDVISNIPNDSTQNENSQIKNPVQNNSNIQIDNVKTEDNIFAVGIILIFSIIGIVILKRFKDKK